MVMDAMERWDRVFEQEDLVKQILEFRTTEDIQKFLKDNGHDFTKDEIIEMGQNLKKAAESLNNSELTADDLEAVAAGANYMKAIGQVCIGTGVAIGGTAVASAAPAVFAAW